MSPTVVLHQRPPIQALTICPAFYHAAWPGWCSMIARTENACPFGRFLPLPPSFEYGGLVIQVSAGSSGMKRSGPGAEPGAGSAAPQEPPATVTPGERMIPAHPGVPAIPPRDNTPGATTPAFTEQDVVDYYQRRGANARVVQVAFVLRKELPQHYPELRPYIAADTLLCVVTLQGTFPISAPPFLAQQRQQTGSVALHVFDARTGNLLTEAVR